MVKRIFWVVLFFTGCAWALPEWMLPGVKFLRSAGLFSLQSLEPGELSTPLPRQDFFAILLKLSELNEGTLLEEARQELPPEKIHTNCLTPSQWANDVSEEANREWVEPLTARGILRLFPSGDFAPARQTSRYEMAAGILRLSRFGDYFRRCLRAEVSRSRDLFEERERAAEAEAPLPFEDLPREHWAYRDVAQLYAQRVLEGMEPKAFRGGAPTTLAQVGVALSRLL